MKSIATTNEQLTDPYPRLMISKYGTIYLQLDIATYILLHPETGNKAKRGRKYTSISEPTIYNGELTISN